MKKNIRIATRRSKLALWQANHVKAMIEKNHPEYTVTLHEMTTEGDQQQSIPLNQIGGKGLFVKSLQQALLRNEADIAVHCIKDMSVYETPKLILGAILQRENPQDAFISPNYANIDSLPDRAIVGTASPRRSSLILSIRPDVEIKLLRGNVDTRLMKVIHGEYDAIILAAAGLIRLNLQAHIRSYLSDAFFTPAIGQGAIGIECRENDSDIRALLSTLHDDHTANCVLAERTVNRILGGDCHTAIGAHATMMNGEMHLSAMVGSLDGQTILRAEATEKNNAFAELGERVAEKLISQGAKDLIQHG